MKVEETNRKAQEIESMLFTMPEIKRVLTNVGTSSSAFAGTQSQNNLAEMNVYLKPVAERQKQQIKWAQILREILWQLPELKFV